MRASGLAPLAVVEVGEEAEDVDESWLHRECDHMANVGREGAVEMEHDVSEDEKGGVASALAGPRESGF
eukprot:4011087-Alexandrium_andersonii.AAC.1